MPINKEDITSATSGLVETITGSAETLWDEAYPGFTNSSLKKNFCAAFYEEVMAALHEKVEQERERRKVTLAVNIGACTLCHGNAEFCTACGKGMNQWSSSVTPV